jgi:hypothetical protein
MSRLDMYYVKYAIPGISQARDLVFVSLSVPEVYAAKMVEDCLYFAPRANVSFKGPGDMLSKKPDHLFLLVDGQLLYTFRSFALMRLARFYVKSCDSVVIFATPKRIFTLNKTNCTSWCLTMASIIIFRRVSNFSWKPFVNRLVRMVKDVGTNRRQS